MNNLINSQVVYIHYTDETGGHILTDRNGFPIKFSFNDFDSGKVEQVLTLIVDGESFAYSPLTEQEVTWAIKNNELNLIAIADANPRSDYLTN